MAKIGDWRRPAIRIVRPKSLQADRAVGRSRIADSFSNANIAPALPLAAFYMTMSNPRDGRLDIAELLSCFPRSNDGST